MRTTHASRRRKSTFVLAATGHRPDKLGGYGDSNPTKEWVKQELKKVIRRVKPNYCISGMALGVDQWFAEVCIELDVPFHAYIPFDGQESVWPHQSKLHYYELLKKAAKVVTVCSPGYEAWKMQKRNMAMVDACTDLVEVFDGSPGGTANCVDYAKKVERREHLIDPEGFDAFWQRKTVALPEVPNADTTCADCKLPYGPLHDGVTTCACIPF